MDNVLKRIRLRARRRVAWLRNLWSEEEARPAQSVVTHAEIDTHLDDRDSPDAEAAWLESEPQLWELNAELARLEAEMDADQTSRLAQLYTIFGLSREESDLLQTCLAVELDPSLARIYAYLHDHASRGYVTEGLVARLFGHGRRSLWGGNSPLRRWEMIAEQTIDPAEPPALVLDPVIRDWLEGGSNLDPSINNAARTQPVLSPMESWPVQETADKLGDSYSNGEEPSVRIRVSGQPRSGRKTFAANVAANLGVSSLIAVDSDRIPDQDWPGAFTRAVRHAVLNKTALAWHGESMLRRPWPDREPPGALHFVITEPGQTLPPAASLVDETVELPIPSLDERLSLWQDLVPESASWPQDALKQLSARHRVLAGEVALIARHKPSSAAEASRLVREISRDRLGSLASLVETPFTMDDLVVNDPLRRALEDIIFEARERPVFWERPEALRLFPQGRGLLALFSGPPGTGKTMSAQVIAASLELDLFRIDLSAVVSKYVGETSQNLERILSRAAHMDVVILFDEADALFGKRTEIRDAHDRFANTDTNYLLQAIESFQGVALLSTNRKSNIDPAFIRRLRYVLEFQKPDAPQRLQIWSRVVSELLGEDCAEALSGELETLSSEVDVNGAQIKFAVLNAHFAARRDGQPPAFTHLIYGIERELMKEGRALSSRDQERLISNAR